jgi:hypothetical protein
MSDERRQTTANRYVWLFREGIIEVKAIVRLRAAAALRSPSV